MTVILRPMTEAEFDSIIATSFEHFVAELVKSGQLTEQEVPAETERRREQHLPQGFATPGMLFLIGLVDGERVGWLWLGMPGVGHHADSAWIYNIEVDEAHRGRGHGRGLMEAAERELAARGVRKIGLNVFGGNTTAIALYNKLGYQVIAQQMSKPLTP